LGVTIIEVGMKICPLCNYVADSENELVGHLEIDHMLPPFVSVQLAQDVKEDDDDLPV